jgi:hypothetical protein
VADLWGTEKLELGSIAEPVLTAFSKDFSSVVSFVATVSAQEFQASVWSLSWAILDSLGGEDEWALEDTQGVFWGAIGMVQDKNGALKPRQSQTRRFIVPARPKLAVSLQPSRMVKGNEPFTGSFEGVTVTLFWRGIG